MSNLKILVSGCGITFSSQEKKTWPNVLQAVGINIIDVSGPAVSNQWILNQAIDHLLTAQDITHVVIQLTSIGKLDVEANEERINELVAPDSIRNFTYKNVWPSSASTEHESKKLWYKWLFSPVLEIQDITVKLMLLQDWCKHRNIELHVYQGYFIPWESNRCPALVHNNNLPWMVEYESKPYYFPGPEKNTVPNIEFHLDLAKKVAKDLQINIGERLEKLSKAYYDKKT